MLEFALQNMLLPSSNLNIQENNSETVDKQIVDGAESTNLQPIVETKFIVIPDSDINSNLTSSSNIMIKEFEENSSFSNHKDSLYENYLKKQSRDNHKRMSPNKYDLNVFKNENLNTKAVASTNIKTSQTEVLFKENLDSHIREKDPADKRDETNCDEELSEDSDTSSECSFSNPTESFLQPIDTHQMTQEFIGFIQELDNYYRKNPSKAQICQHKFSNFPNKYNSTENVDSDDQQSCSQSKLKGVGRGIFKSTLNSPRADEVIIEQQTDLIEPLNESKLVKNLQINSLKNEKETVSSKKADQNLDTKSEKEKSKEQNEEIVQKTLIESTKTQTANNNTIQNEKCMRSISSQTETNIIDLNQSRKTTLTAQDNKPENVNHSNQKEDDKNKSKLDSKEMKVKKTDKKTSVAKNTPSENLANQNLNPVSITTNVTNLRLRSVSPLSRTKLREQESTSSIFPSNRDHISNRDQFYAQMYPKEYSGPVNYNNYASRSFSQPHGAYNNQVQSSIDLNNQLYHYQQFIQEYYQNQSTQFGYNGYNDGHQHQYPPYDNLAYYQNSYMNPAYYPNRFSYF